MKIWWKYRIEELRTKAKEMNKDFPAWEHMYDLDFALSYSWRLRDYILENSKHLLEDN